MSDSTFQSHPVVMKYKNRILQCGKQPKGPPAYVPGDEICVDVPREVGDKQLFSGPVVCHLCDDTALYRDNDFDEHLATEHTGESEYRNCVLHLMDKNG